MSSKSIIRVTCPECGGLLEIDVSREKVLAHTSRHDLEKASPQEKEKMFDDVVQRVNARKDKGNDLFDAALKKVEETEDRLDALFGEVKKKVSEEAEKGIDPEDDPRRLFWD